MFFVEGRIPELLVNHCAVSFTSTNRKVVQVSETTCFAVGSSVPNNRESVHRGLASSTYFWFANERDLSGPTGVPRMVCSFILKRFSLEFVKADRRGTSAYLRQHAVFFPGPRIFAGMTFPVLVSRRKL